MWDGVPNTLPDLLNTPGIYYAVAYWCCSVLMLHMLPLRYKGWKKWVLLIGDGVVLAFFMTVTKDVSRLLFIPTMGVIVTILFFIFWAIADVDARSAVYYTIRAFIMGEFLASFEWQILYFLVVNGYLALNIKNNLLLAFPIYVLILLAVYFLEVRFKEQNRDLDLTISAVLGELAIAIVVYAFSNVSFVAKHTPFSAHYTNEILVLRTSVDVAGVIALYMYHMLINQMHTRMEVTNLQNMLNTQYANYKISRDSIDLINRKYHDLKHQIAILKSDVAEGSLMTRDEKLKYLNDLEADIRTYESENKTGNNVLDIILTGKSLACRNHGIEMTVMADGEALNFMDIMDLSSLFGNALDNAIESVRKIEDRSRRLINVTVVRKKGFVRIGVENTYTGTLTFKDGLPVTSKKDKSNHGFGVKSMRNIVEKYGGGINFEARGHWFILNIVLPDNEDNKMKEN